ncbi:replication factor C subunit 3-like [Carica papaya]|uniref:replication factor C subunit 3-like n=1 Tax=Carica papaya TaxID=3649 RepID=UPI000B8C74C0|nr:replication factor C subunit 3-like [Carica papaya]
MPAQSTIPVRSASCSDPGLTTKMAALKNRVTTRSETNSSKSNLSYWLRWTNTNILRCRRGGDSELTQESLEAHNRKHSYVPYVLGDLLDDAGANHRYRKYAGSPGRDSHATTFASNSTSSSSFSIFILKMQELGSSCFTFKTRTTTAAVMESTRSKNSPVTRHPHKNRVTAGDGSKSGNVDRSEASVGNVGKPLRERVRATSDGNDEDDGNKKDSRTVEKGNERFVWANKYRPKALENFICNRDKATQLQTLMSEGGCDHVIFQGPPGVGKRTMIRALLRAAFGAENVQTKTKPKTFDLKGEIRGKIEVNVKESSQHVEINVSDLKGYEKHVIVELIKKTHSRIIPSKPSLNSSPDSTCQAIILREADKLSTDALLYIRWLLERYRGSNKFFFCCSDISKLQPIKSLCTVVQLFPPSKQEIIEVLEFIANQEGIDLPYQLAEKIAENSKNNLRQAIRSFEACFYSCYPFKEDQEILTGWEEDIANIAKNIIEEQSPKELYVIRGKLKNLIEHDVSPEYIFKTLVEELKKHLDEAMQLQVQSLYEDYNRNSGNMFESEKSTSFGRRSNPMRKNLEHFLRIEEFTAKFMSCYSHQSRKSNTCNLRPTINGDCEGEEGKTMSC